MDPPLILFLEPNKNHLMQNFVLDDKNCINIHTDSFLICPHSSKFTYPWHGQTLTHIHSLIEVTDIGGGYNIPKI